MPEPRIHPLSDAEADGTQALLIANAEHKGAPDPLCARRFSAWELESASRSP